MVGDLDFDELDKAVNSLMGSRGDEAKGERQADISRSSFAPRNAEPQIVHSGPMPSLRPSAIAAREAKPVAAPHLQDAPLTDTQEPAAVQVAPKILSNMRPSAPAVRRASGRFMDVFHPSSDMRRSGNSQISAVSAPRTESSISRQGVSLAPATTVAAPIVERAPVAVPSTPVAHDLEIMKEPPHELAKEQDVAPHHDWPDPIALHEATNLDAANSPFLPEAHQVEKRPLGSFVKEDDAPIDQMQSPMQPQHAHVDEPTDDINDAILKLESNQANRTAPSVSVNDWSEIGEKTFELDQQTKDIVDDEDEDDSVFDLSSYETEPKKEEPKTTPVTPAPIPETKAVFSGPTQISQQYTEQPTTSDQTTGHIFDVEPSKTSVKHTPRQHSGWGLFFGIILIILLIAGAAVAAYIFLLKGTL